MKNLKLVKYFILLIIFTSSNSLFAQSIRVVSENFPPFHYDSNNTIQGSVINLMEPALKEFDLTIDDIEMYPWARTYKIALQEPNTLILSLVRFPGREDLFKWVAPVGYMRVAVFKLKSRTDIQISNTSDLNNYVSGVFIDSATHHFYDKNYITNYEPIGNFDSLPNMLIRGRVELVPASSHGFLSRVSAMGFDVNDIEIVYYIKELEKGLWAGFHKDTSDEIVIKMRDAIEKSKKDNKLISIPFK